MIKEFFRSEDYKNFRTWDEMVYIQTMIAKYAQSVSKEEMRSFCDNFPKRVEELKSSDVQFKEDYNDYMQLKSNPNFIVPPKTDKDRKLNKMLFILKDINIACKIPNINNEEVLKKQKAVQMKYADRFRLYRKENNQNNKDISIISIKKKIKEI